MDKIKDENSKYRILEAAIKLFAARGFDGVSIREICKEAKTNVCMISYYFGGKKELYEGIKAHLIEKQTAYASTFIDLDTDTSKLSKRNQIDLLMLILDKFIDFFYSDNISKELIIFLLKEQQNGNLGAKSPVINFLRKLIADIFEKDKNNREIIFKTLFLLSQINSPRILPAFSLNLLGQDDFIKEDIKIIKDNIKMYVKTLLKEAKID